MKTIQKPVNISTRMCFPFVEGEEKILVIKNWTEILVNGKKGIKTYESFDEDNEISLEDGGSAIPKKKFWVIYFY